MNLSAFIPKYVLKMWTQGKIALEQWKVLNSKTLSPCGLKPFANEVQSKKSQSLKKKFGAKKA